MVRAGGCPLGNAIKGVTTVSNLVDISDLLDPDEIKSAKISVKAPNGKTVRLDVSYYPNRLTTEQADDDDTEPVDVDFDAAERPPAPSWDTSFCEFMHGWNLAVPVKNKRGELVPGTGSGTVVPFDPWITQFLPLWLKQGVQNEILEVEFPSRAGSRGSRRR